MADTIDVSGLRLVMSVTAEGHTPSLVRRGSTVPGRVNRLFALETGDAGENRPGVCQFKAATALLRRTGEGPHVASLWMARAFSPFAVSVLPEIKTVESVGATFDT
jgi:hypothetical protein